MRNTTAIFAEKMREAYAVQKLLTYFHQNILALVILCVPEILNPYMVT